MCACAHMYVYAHILRVKEQLILRAMWIIGLNSGDQIWQHKPYHPSHPSHLICLRTSTRLSSCVRPWAHLGKCTTTDRDPSLVLFCCFMFLFYKTGFLCVALAARLA